MQPQDNAATILELYEQWYAANALDTRYFMVVPSTISGHTNDYMFKDVTSFIDGDDEVQNYEINYNVDKQVYKNLGRGYDSTVWRKIVAENGDAKYVMLAELNSVVPTFDIAVDAPTNEPTAPHFGADKSNVYYPLHVQANWGFRIGKAEEGQSDAVIDDYVSYNVTENSIIPETVDGYTGGYNAAIYFNRDGFDPSESHASGMDYNENYISMEPVESGAVYENHDANHTKSPKPDIQELKIILPALGDAVNTVYNKMAGESRKWSTK